MGALDYVGNDISEPIVWEADSDDEIDYTSKTDDYNVLRVSGEDVLSSTGVQQSRFEWRMLYDWLAVNGIMVSEVAFENDFSESIEVLSCIAQLIDKVEDTRRSSLEEGTLNRLKTDIRVQQKLNDKLEVELSNLQNECSELRYSNKRLLEGTEIEKKKNERELADLLHKNRLLSQKILQLQNQNNRLEKVNTSMQEKLLNTLSSSKDRIHSIPRKATSLVQAKGSTVKAAGNGEENEFPLSEQLRSSATKNWFNQCQLAFDRKEKALLDYIAQLMESKA